MLWTYSRQTRARYNITGETELVSLTHQHCIVGSQTISTIGLQVFDAAN